MAVAEAQTLGIPSVVMDFGCMNERVINNKTGFVCQNELEFCEKTISLLNVAHKNTPSTKCCSYKHFVY